MAGSSLGEPFLLEELRDRPALGSGYQFFVSVSLRVSTSRSRSASSRFSRPFSFSSSRSRLTSLSAIEPYFRFHYAIENGEGKVWDFNP